MANHPYKVHDICKRCIYFDDWEGGSGNGTCKRYAPRPKLRSKLRFVDDANEFYATWPVVHEEEWCGEFKLDYDKNND